jgi:hypothetical protein
MHQKAQNILNMRYILIAEKIMLESVLPLALLTKLMTQLFRLLKS